MVFLGIHNAQNRVRYNGYSVRQTPTGGWSASSPASTVGPHRGSWENFYSGLYGGVNYINQSVGGGGLGDVARSTYDPNYYQSNNSSNYSNSYNSRANIYNNNYFSNNQVQYNGYSVRQTPTGGWSASSPASTVGPHRGSWENFYSGLYGGVNYINQSVGGGGLGDVARQSWQGVNNNSSLYGAAGIIGYNQTNSSIYNPNGGLNFNVQNHFNSVNPFSVPGFRSNGAFSFLNT